MAKKTVTITINVEPDFKERLQNVADQFGSGSLSAEIVERLKFTLKWAGSSSVSALDSAMSVMSPLSASVLALTTEQKKRLKEGAYQCAAIQNIAQVSPYGENVFSKADSDNLFHRNALAEFMAPRPLSKLQEQTKFSIDEVLFNTQLDIQDDCAAMLSDVPDPIFFGSNNGVNTALNAINAFVPMAKEWINSTPLPSVENAESLQARRMVTQQLHSARSLFLAFSNWLELYIRGIHQMHSAKAISHLAVQNLSLETLILADSEQAIVSKAVDVVDGETCSAIGFIQPALDLADEYLQRVRALNRLKHAE